MFKRLFLNFVGFSAVGLAIAGAFLPLLPTTPFLILAASCFSSSSPRMKRWLYTNRWFGETFKNYRKGNGIPLRAKISTLVILWLTLGYTIFFVLSGKLLGVRILLYFIGCCVTVHVLWIKTSKSKK